MNIETKLTPNHRAERKEIIKNAKVFAPLLTKPDITEEEIDAAIEELRTLRMHVHAIDFGDAPGYRKTVPDKATEISKGE